MGILSWIILGLVVGILAKWIMPGRDPGGVIITTLLESAEHSWVASSGRCLASEASPASTWGASFSPSWERSCCSGCIAGFAAAPADPGRGVRLKRSTNASGPPGRSP